MESFGFGMICVLGTTAIAVIGFFTFRRFIKPADLTAHHHISEPMLALVGTLFSVLLGFLVAGAISRYSAAHQYTMLEANAIADVYRLARGFDHEAKLTGTIRALCREYSLVVIEEEWPLMEKHTMSLRAWEVLGVLWERCLEVNPTTDRENNIHAAMLNALDQAGENRRMRSLIIIGQSPPELWVVTSLGGAIIIGFTYFFYSERTLLHGWMVGMVAVSLALNMFLLIAFSQAFSGVLKIRPNAFILNIDLMQREEVRDKPLSDSTKKSLESKPGENSPMVEVQ